MADQILQDIKNRLNVVDVLGSYIRLTKAGVNFKAPCPFHHEKTPSLVVSPQKQIWHCFGCGEGGDIFGFVMKHENLDFREALKILADRAGLQLPAYSGPSREQQDETEKLYRINDFAARFYHEMLTKDKRGKAALSYLRDRGLSDRTLQKWMIGYAPDEFHALERALSFKQVSVGDMLAAGVSAKNEKGNVYDRFRNRITFPVFNFFGKIVGFSARIMPQQDSLPHAGGGQAKYVNSPETQIYSKSNVLFGLFQAKAAIRRTNEVVVVEGQMDCIAPHQAGFENVVATSGTALTADQLALLGRLTKNIVFCFDSDSAGQEAARRGAELALAAGFRLKTIQLTGAKDPDELVKKSPGLWEKAVREAIWYLDYAAASSRASAPGDPLAQIHSVSERVIPLLGYITDPLEQDHYIRKLTQEFGISERAVRQQIKQGAVVSRPPATEPVMQSADRNREKEILGGCLVFPEFLQMVMSESSAEEFEHPDIRPVVTALMQQRVTSLARFDSPVAKEAQFMVESMVEQDNTGAALVEKQLEKSFALFKLQSIKKQQQRVTAELAAAQTSQAAQSVAELSRHFAELSKLRMQYEQRL